jgi:leucyl aminopeptidase (aminopeptidase T)
MDRSPTSASFAPAFEVDSELKAAAAIAVRESLKIAKDERVIIITNPAREVLAISEALYDATLEAGARPTILIQPVKGQMDYTEEAVIAAFESQPDVVLSISAEKMGKDRDGIQTPYEWDGVSYDHVFHYQLHGAKTLRSFWSPSVTIEMFKGTVPIDYGELKDRCRRLSAIIDGSSSIRVTNANGTDLTVGLAGRKAKADDGDFSQPGSGGNLPAGEVFVSPALGSARGVIVYDGSIANAIGDIIIKEPIRCEVEGGFVVKISGGTEARELEATIDEAARSARRMGAEGKLPAEKASAYEKNARSIGELGIGLNPKARVVGNMLEDEKALHTCHFAIGANYDDDAPALIHLDGLVSRPTIVAIAANGKETVIEKEGEILV